MASTEFLVPAIGDEKPLTPKEKEDLEKWRTERRAEKAALKTRVIELKKEIGKMPEWRELQSLSSAYKEALIHASQTFEVDWAAEEAADDADEIREEMEEYRKTIFLPALKAHPLGPEFIAAHKRLKELKWT